MISGPVRVSATQSDAPQEHAAPSANIVLRDQRRRGALGVDIFSADTLVQAIANRARDGRQIAFLLGSALTAPYRGQLGVPGVVGMIDLVRDSYSSRTRDQFNRLIATASRNTRYQAAFGRLLATHGMKTVNRVIRQAVLSARLHPDSLESRALKGSPEACLELERDLSGWHLSPGLEALGRMLNATGQGFCELILTSNFDPLIEVAIKRMGGRVFRTVLHGDGELRLLEEDGCHVVHFHGDWWRSDTLHTPTSLLQERPKLTNALSRILRERTLVVLGYGGWDDVFAQSLVQVVRSGDLAGRGDEGLDVLWGFYSSDRALIERDYAHLFSSLADGISRGRILFYSGVNLHRALPEVETSLAAVSSTGLGRSHAPGGGELTATLVSAQDEPLWTSRRTSDVVARASDTEVEQEMKTLKQER